VTTLSVAVLIPAHNEEATIAGLVQAVLGQPRPIEQLIVVADSCTDDTARVAREAGATLVLETNFADKAANQNYALPYITADVIVGFDGDSRPLDDCIDLMVQDLERGYDATCSSILPMQETGFFIEARRFAYSLGSQWWRLCQRQIGRLQVLTGASYAFRADVIRKLGGFPNGLISADMDVTWKLHEEGYKTWYTSKAVTLTIDPETWKEYKAQMPRWSAGYFQNIARYKRLMWNWRSLMVVGTALFDLVTLWWWVFVVAYNLTTWQHLSMFRYMGYWFIGHTALTVFLVSRVVGWKKAFKGFIPYTTLNFYNKWLYTKALIREWVLGKHYMAWTGRTGRPVEITPMTRERKRGLSLISSALGLLSFVMGGIIQPSVVGLCISVLFLVLGLIGLVTSRKRGKRAAPKRGKKKRKNPPRSLTAAIPQQRVDDTVPLRTVRLLDPWAENTTEIPLPTTNIRGGTTD
jgi:cellulose synthase/poly-beta-1,6-N-acetylglucosamine synthase-like glycosyltransferase